MARLTQLMLDFSIEVEAPLSEEHIRHALLPLLEDSSIGDVWVAEEEELVGYLVITWGWGIESGGKEALIDELYVAKENRSQGLGKALLQAALDRAAELGTKSAFLETEADNPQSRELYKSVGFVEESSVWMRASLKADD